MADRDLQELIDLLKSVRDALPEVLARTATSMSMTAKALSERTIKDRGFGETYSTIEIPAYWMYGKWMNNRGRDYLYGLKDKGGGRGRKKIEDIQNEDLISGTTTWGKFRKAQGLQNAFVDLTYSGKMWAGMFPGEVEVSGFKYIAPLGGSNVEAQEKMNWNYAQYGDFIGATLTGDNLDALYNVGIDELIRFLNEKMGWAKQ